SRRDGRPGSPLRARRPARDRTEAARRHLGSGGRGAGAAGAADTPPRGRGGFAGGGAEGWGTLALPIPDADARRRHWEAALGTASSAPTGFGDRFRMTGGHIRRAGRLARAG